MDAGLARWDQTLGTAPFEFADVEITPKGRLEQQRRSATDQKVVETVASPPPASIAVASPAIRLFISHSDHDVEIARRLVRLMRAALNLPAEVIRCTSLDGHRLPGGTHTEQQLRREVNTAEAFIGILSDDSLRSLFVLFELGARWGVEKHLIPLLAPGFPVSRLKAPLDGLNALTVENVSQLHQLVTDVAALLRISQPSPAAYAAELTALHTVGEHRHRQAARADRISNDLRNRADGPIDADIASPDVEKKALPKFRPKLAPIRYRKNDSRLGSGLTVQNDGVTAYDVSIPSLEINGSIIQVDGNTGCLEKHAQMICAIDIEHASGGLEIGALFDFLHEQRLAGVDLSICYRDFEEHWYATTLRSHLVH